DYLVRNRRELRDIAVGPDEHCILIRKGRIEEFASQTQVDAVPGLLRRFMDFVGTKTDVQLVIVSTRRHELAVPFEAYSRDRDLIRGTANLAVSISKDSASLALRLLKEGGSYGDACSEEGFRQFCVEDLRELIGGNTQYVIDTEVVSSLGSDEIQANRPGICTDIISALNSKTPYWANYGLSVNYTTVSIDANEFESLERRDRENRMASRRRDLEFAEASGDSDQAVRLRDVVNRESAAMELSEYLSKVNADASKRLREDEIAHERSMARIGHREDELTRDLEARNRLEMLAVYHQREKDRIRDDSEISEADKQVRIAEIEARLAAIRLQTARQEYDLDSYKADSEADRERRRKEFDMELELRRKREEARILAEMSERDYDLRNVRQSQGHEERMAEIEKEVKVADISARSGVETARAQLDGYREGSETSHRRSMDNAAMTERIVSAASGKGAAVIYCPACGMESDPRARFCGGCGAKLRRDAE
ncbi:MAG: hypothetical protein Q4Q62_07985, partial [Thermoplasmata archaeon]|nr:hypothetical protein [Thermoplasmata archaeon]